MADNPAIRDPRIDAWRGLSILLVIAGHLLQFRYREALHISAFHQLHSASFREVLTNVLFRVAQPLPSLGVLFFFVISGYLITSILLREEQRNGSISISAFYIRRVFRILPAFAIFLSGLAALSAAGIILLPLRAFLGAALFLCDTSYRCGNWWVGHTWTLAVEEQFYLLWPFIFCLLAGRNRAAWLLLGYLLAVGSSYISFASKIWVDPSVPGLAFSCTIAGAFVACRPEAMRVIQSVSNSVLLLLLIALLLAEPLFASVPVVAAVMRPISPLMVAVILFGSLQTRTVLGPVLSWRWLTWIGLVSYSLYLWQQLFTGDVGQGGGVLAHYTILSLPIAAASYFLIEKPLIRIGHRVSSMIMERRRKLVGVPASAAAFAARTAAAENP